MFAFLSHNSNDKAIARKLGGQLKLVGADVWFDSWELKAGDSIVGKVNDALASVDTVILVWSNHASRSDWVRAEMEAAITRALADRIFRVIPVRLDDIPLPPLLTSIKRVDLFDDDVSRAVDEIMGFTNDSDRLRAIQGTLDEAGITVEYFHGYGAVVCCPRCGAGVNRLKAWSATDHSRDDMYAGLECLECGFSDGGEI